MDKEVYTIKDYGTIYIDIHTIMEERNISRNALARALNTRFEVINKWYNGTVEKIDSDILARMCYVLECRPEDIIKYQDSDEDNKS